MWISCERMKFCRIGDMMARATARRSKSPRSGIGGFGWCRARSHRDRWCRPSALPPGRRALHTIDVTAVRGALDGTKHGHQSLLNDQDDGRGRSDALERDLDGLLGEQDFLAEHWRRTALTPTKRAVHTRRPAKPRGTRIRRELRAGFEQFLEDRAN